MNMTELLNKNFYPGVLDNVQGKGQNLFDTITVVNGTTEYNLFTNPSLNLFNRNAQFPLSGNTIFFAFGITASLDAGFLDASLTATQLSQLLFTSFAQIFVNERLMLKVPVYEILNLETGLALGNTSVQTLLSYNNGYDGKTNKRMFQKPLVFNSLSNVSVILELDTNITAALADNLFRFEFLGLQYDKISDFQWNQIKNKSFQSLDFTIYEVQTISGAAADTYTLFSNANQSKNNYSQTLPPSDIDTFQAQAIEIVFNINSDLKTIFDDKKTNYLTILVNDKKIIQTDLTKIVSVLANQTGALDDSGATTMNYVSLEILRQQLILETPILFPSNSNVQITLDQPGGSTGDATTFLAMLKGLRTRQRV